MMNIGNITLPENHEWKDVDSTWLKGNEYMWECEKCKQQLIGVANPDGTFELLDVGDLTNCEV